jgi:hypothetical protein
VSPTPVAVADEATVALGFAPEETSATPTLDDLVVAVTAAAEAAGVRCERADVIALDGMFSTAYREITAEGRIGGAYLLPRSFLDSHAYRVMEATIADDTPARHGDGSVLDLLTRRNVPTDDPRVLRSFRHSAIRAGVRDFCSLALVVEAIEV